MNYPLVTLQTHLTELRKQLILMKTSEASWIRVEDIQAVEAMIEQYETAISILEEKE